jgi:glycosyltransferase involved in cell wall biosynthesis
MKVLLVHNYYGSDAPSGENIAFEFERDMLTSNGLSVRTFETHSDQIRGQGLIGALKAAAVVAWNPLSARKISSVISEFEPDVVHAHNLFPLISASVFSASKRAARVLTLHNYRLFCANAIPMRRGKPCTECLTKRSVVPALTFGCYRGSRLATLPIAAGIAVNRARGTWSKDIDAFIALTEYQRNVMHAAGLAEDLIYLKPNSLVPPTSAPLAIKDRPDQVAFVGRLSEEKGIRILIEAWLKWGDEAPLLKVIGGGPLFRELQEKTRTSTNIVLAGNLNSFEAKSEIARSKLLVVPSLWFEGLPIVVVEAFSYGTPLLVSRIGSLPMLVRGGAGRTFLSGDSDDLVTQAKSIMGDALALEGMAKSAKEKFDSDHSPQQNFDALISIYRSALARRQSRDG